MAVLLTFKFWGVNAPFTVKFCSITRSLPGIRILPVPLARNSKSLLLSVVVIMLSSIWIFSNWNAPATDNVLTSKLFAVIFPLAVRLVSVSPPLIATSPATDRSAPPAITTLPVPLAESSKLLLLSDVLIVLLMILIFSENIRASMIAEQKQKYSEHRLSEAIIGIFS